MDVQPPTPQNNPPVPQFQPAPPNQSGMSTGAKVGIGCGVAALVIAILGGVAAWMIFGKIKDFVKNPERTITETIVSNHPDLENPQFDDEAKTVTVTYKKDGKQYTIDYSDAAKGKIEFKDSDGNITTLGSTDTSQIPDWVPQPETAENYIVLYSTNNNGKSAGQYVASVIGDLTKLNDDLKEKLDKKGYNTSTTSAHANNTGRWQITAKKDNRHLNLTMVQSETKSHLTVSWKE